MAKRRKKKQAIKQAPEKKSVNKTALGLLFALVGATVVALTVYRFLMNTPYFQTVLVVYMVIGALAAVGYVVYNRGLSRRGVTVDMLPAEWSDEKKEAFVADGARRMKRSRWVLVVAFAIFVTFAVDLIELYALPTFMKIFGIGS